ncbi:MAG: hypothetical protein KDI15_12205, partial [Thiothrix sp.]|nr:hypothetical protein [Thiothrix sp.]
MQHGTFSFDHRGWLGRLMQISLLTVLAAGTGWAAGTVANTLIRNQASATFKDDAGQVFSVTSNMVETLVQQAAGVELVQDQSKRTRIGGEVHFPHVLTNVGNGPDTFDLTATNVATTDNFDFSSLTLYADLNQDGQPDDLTSPITTTPLLGPDQSFAFVVVARLPGTETSTQQGAINVTGSSQFTPAINDSNVDVAIVTDQAVIDVTKSISATAGPAGTTDPLTDPHYTVTLTYENISMLPATNVTLIDALPTGMRYVAGSGRWSQAGAMVLTDAGPSDAQTATPYTITYCAYDSSCTGLAEATQDADTDSTNQVTAIINQVPAGIRGNISFEVTIAPDQLAGFLHNTGEFLYHDGSTNIPATLTNKVVFEVIASSGVVTNGSNSSAVDGTAEPITIASTTQAGIIRFTDYVWNTGNGDDSFDLSLSASTFPPGTSIQLFHPDGNTPLLDTNGNG